MHTIDLTATKYNTSSNKYTNMCRTVALVMSRDSRKHVLTNRETMVSPGICDAEGGRADRCMSRVSECRRLLMCYSLTILWLCSWKLSLQHGNAAAGRVDVGCDAQWTNTESPIFPGGAHGSGDSHYARRVHADWNKEVLSWMLSWSRSHRILDY